MMQLYHIPLTDLLCMHFNKFKLLSKQKDIK
nr:MAG TPA: hypothetical protein [Caudoviricetes sp.]